MFANSKKLCDWTGFTATNNESARKKKTTRISCASIYLKSILVQYANSAIRDSQNNYFKHKYDKLKKRHGHKKAIITICKMMLTAIYNMFKHGLYRIYFFVSH